MLLFIGLNAKNKHTVFDTNWLSNLEQNHEKLHAIANGLYRKYEQGDFDSAKAGLAELYIVLDDINNILELEHSIKTLAPLE